MAKTNGDQQDPTLGVVAGATLVALNLLGLIYIGYLQDTNPDKNWLPFFIIFGFGTLFGIALTIYAFRRRAAFLALDQSGAARTTKSRDG
jgi:hypothetical protein